MMIGIGIPSSHNRIGIFISSRKRGVASAAGRAACLLNRPTSFLIHNDIGSVELSRTIPMRRR